MERKTVWGVFAVLVVMSVTNAQAAVEVLHSDWQSTRLKFTLEGYATQSIDIQGVAHSVIHSPGLVIANRRGEPALPQQGVSVQLPASSQAPELVVISESSTWENLGAIAPGRGSITRNVDPSTVPYVFGPLYQATRFAPQPMARVAQLFTLRDVRGANVVFAPFQYDPASGRTLVTREAIIEIRTPAPARATRSLFVAPAGASRAARPTLSQDFASLYQDRFVNYSQLTAEAFRGVGHPVLDTGKLLVITHADFARALQPLVDWKNQKGIQTRLVTLAETGSTATAIKAFIAAAYRAERISSVILVGDAKFMPFFPGVFGNAYRNEADPLYGAIEGPSSAGPAELSNDEFPEVFVSRLPANTALEASTMVAKIIDYERDAVAGDWYAKASGIASNEAGGPDDLYDWERMNLVSDMLMPWGYTVVDKFYDPRVTLDQLVAAINQGRGFLNYVGHGSETEWVTTGLHTSDIMQLKNDRKLPFIVDVACVNGNFAFSEMSFAEAWMLVGTPEVPRGAISIFASSTNQEWYEPTIGQKHIAELLTKNVYNTIGTLFLHGSIAVLEADLEGSNQTFETWHIFGDPTVQVRTRSPEAIQASAMPSQVSATAGSFSMRVGQPGVVVALSQGGKLLGRAISGADGQISLKFAGSTGGKAKITATGFNLKTLVQEVTITN